MARGDDSPVQVIEINPDSKYVLLIEVDPNISEGEYSELRHKIDKALEEWWTSDFPILPIYSGKIGRIELKKVIG